jgi:hypothetical protein
VLEYKDKEEWLLVPLLPVLMRAVAAATAAGSRLEALKMTAEFGQSN